MNARLGRSAVVALAILLAWSWFPPHGSTRTIGTDMVGRIVPTGNTVEPRFDHTATLLPSGQVLIAAGMARNGVTEPTAELYNPQTGKFIFAGRLQSPRGWGVTATRLLSGKILLAGGANASWCDASCYLASAELYDPSSGTFTSVGSMTESRAGANAILLHNGDVLIVGGNQFSGHGATAELYHPATRTFSVTGSMHSDSASMLVLLKNSKVLALSDSGGELYDPETGRFMLTRNLMIGRTKFGAALLSDGRLLIVGGQLGGAWGPKSAATNIYDPAPGVFTRGPNMSFTRFKLKKAVVPLGDGRVLVAGGADKPEVYDPTSNSFHTVDSRLDCYYFSTATVLSNGQVLIVGGYSRPGGPAVNHAWLYQP